MHIHGSTRVFLILGDPVEQVRAPQVFNHLFARHGVDAVLVPVRVPPANLADFARTVLRGSSIDGLWLTIPHKNGMHDLLDRCDMLGRVAGSVNAARVADDGALEGALFDGIGFVGALRRFSLPVAGTRALIVGAGGAGVAIGASLAQQGVGALGLVDATRGRAEAAAARIRAGFPGAAVECPERADPAGWNMVVNATPLGLQPDDPLPFDVARLDPGAAVVDILMKSAPTPLLRACTERRVPAFSGHEMLIQQMPDYLSFFGFDSIAAAVREDASDVRALVAAH